MEVRSNILSPEETSRAKFNIEYYEYSRSHDWESTFKVEEIERSRGIFTKTERHIEKVFF